MCYLFNRVPKGLGILLFLSLAFCSYGQSGPGGVGNSSTNVLWLQANSLSGLNQGDDVLNWLDQSGNNNSLSQPNVLLSPTYLTAAVNGLPALRFSKNNARIRKLNFNNFPSTSISQFFVNASNESNDGLLSYASAVNNNDFLLFSSNSLRIYRGGATNSGISFNGNTWNIAAAQWRSSDGRAQVWKNGLLGYQTAGFQTGSSISPGGCLALAGEQDAVDANYDAAQAHSGDFSEIIIFDFFLNLAQNILVSNYLSSKYNLAIANDYFSFDINHGHQVVGIGREDINNQHTAATSDNLITIQNARNLDLDREYLLLGHDNTDRTSWTANEAPNNGLNIQRIAREWRIQETGELGNLDILIDPSQLPPAPLGLSLYALMIDDDGDFSTGATVIELTQASGSNLQLRNINLNNGQFLSLAVLRPTVQFSSPSSSGLETNNATVDVQINFSPRANKTIDYSCIDGTAQAGQPDYISSSNSLIFTAGISSISLGINIVNDVLIEASEAFSISLSNPSSGLIIGTTSVHQYTILDDDNPRKIYFDAANTSLTEGNVLVNINVSINNIDLVNSTSVDYAITAGTASLGTDYTFTAGPLIIPAGSNTGIISLSIQEDLLAESDETIEISLQNPSNCNLDAILPFGGTGIRQHTVLINDDEVPPQVEFSSASASGLENSSVVNIPIQLDQVSGQTVSVQYIVSGTASSGLDFVLTNGSITLNSGTTTAFINATIIDDSNEELPETIFIELINPSNASLGSVRQFTYTIVDNDLFGFSGPAGVGNNNNNVLWVKSNDLNGLLDGNNISTWPDASGNNHDLSQSNPAFCPRYYRNIVHGQAVVRFEQNNGRLIRNAFNAFPSNQITSIIVNRNNDSNDGLLSYAVPSNNNEYLWFNSNQMNIYRGPNSNTNTPINGNNWNVLQHHWLGNTGASNFYQNGQLQASSTLAAGTSILSGGCLAIAGEQDAVNANYDINQAHFGDFTEIILFDVVLNSARRKIIDNYLAAKYDITIINDMYVHDALGSYEHEVAGIGQDALDSYHLDAQGTAELRINSPSNLNNGDYLFWGNNGQDIFIPNTLDIPSAQVSSRSEKVWRFSRTGDLGNVDVMFDVSNFPMGLSSNLVLLLDNDDGSFVNATIIPISSFSGNTAQFEQVTIADGQWLTIATRIPSALPVELQSFEAVKLQTAVELRWVTQSEYNNAYFEIQRSSDAQNWKAIAVVPGQLFSTSITTYRQLDSNPAFGQNYYRLKQVDVDASFEYSKIVTVFFDDNGQALQVYPNPSSDYFYIRGQLQHRQDLRLFDISGKAIVLESFRIKAFEQYSSLDLSNMEAGIYWLKTSNQVFKLTVNH